MTWLSITEASLLLRISPRAIRKRIEAYQFQYVDGIGGNKGKVLQIALESLPQHIQDKYHNLLDEAERQECAALITDCTDKQREAADRKARIVHEFDLSGMSGKRFIEQYNEKSG